MGVPLAAAPLAYALLVIIPALSLYGLMRDQSFVESGLFHMRAVTERGEWYRMVTPAFLHADLGHLVVNMIRSEEHTSELQSLTNLVRRLLL